MSCTRRGFLKTIAGAMVGLGLTRLEPLRSFAAGSVSSTGTAELGGPATGPFSIDSLRAQAVQAARWAGDGPLADELQEVCCWAPAATALRKRPLEVQAKSAERFFSTFPGGDQLADVLVRTNNTSFQKPKFLVDPDEMVERHYAMLRKPQGTIRKHVFTPQQFDGRSASAELGLMLDRKTGERLAQTAERSEPMWAALSVFSGIMLDPTNELSSQLTPQLSLRRARDRALARTASIRYSQIVIGAVQRAIWSDVIDEDNAALPLVELTSAGYLPLGEEGGRYLLLRVDGRNEQLTGYRTGSI